MLMSFDQAIAAAKRHIDSAVSLRDEQSEDITYLDNEESAEQRIREADHQLAFVTSIIVESVVNTAMKPKAWLDEDQMLSREGRSPGTSRRAIEAVWALRRSTLELREEPSFRMTVCDASTRTPASMYDDRARGLCLFIRISEHRRTTTNLVTRIVAMGKAGKDGMSAQEVFEKFGVM